MNSYKIRIPTIIFILLTSMVLNAQERWNFRLVLGDNEFGPVNIILYLDKDANTFTMHSTNNADRRMVGYFKGTIARAIKKMPKGGVLISMSDGRIISQNAETDSLYGIFKIPMVGVKPFKGIEKSGKITGELYDNGQPIGVLEGVKVDQDFRFNYTAIAQRIADTTNKYIYNKSVLSDNKWKRFEKKTKKISAKAVDDVELFIGVNMLTPKLPFSHFNLWFMSPEQTENLLKPSASKNVFWKETDAGTAYVEIKSFGGEAEEMDSVFLQILKNPYKNLIIDLRKNPGGGLQAALGLGKYVCNQEINAGYFVTNKWFSEHKGDRNPEFESLPVTQAKTTNDFIGELKISAGKKLVFIPGKKVFTGTIYILTSRNTASTCEPFVDAMKSNKLATIVGEKTAGAMLSKTSFQLKDNFSLLIPLADYYTADKRRLDQNGVEPDIKIDADKALEHVLSLINLKK